MSERKFVCRDCGAQVFDFSVEPISRELCMECLTLRNWGLEGDEALRRLLGVERETLNPVAGETT